jgi:hypothetical protein
MSKRFTDTEKWKKPFIRNLKAPYKLLWLYILDECDHAGIWQVDFDVAQIKIGEKLNYQTALKYLSDKVVPFSGGEKWFIPEFIEFQYGALNPENRAHNSVLQILKKYNILKIDKPLTSPLQGAADEAMDMDMDKDMVKDKEIGAIENFVAVKELTPEEAEFEDVQIWIGKNAPRVNKMKEPLTMEQYFNLKERYGPEMVADVLQDMHNWNDLLKKRICTYRTFTQSFAERKLKNNPV